MEYRRVVEVLFPPPFLLVMKVVCFNEWKTTVRDFEVFPVRITSELHILQIHGLGFFFFRQEVKS